MPSAIHERRLGEYERPSGTVRLLTAAEVPHGIDAQPDRYQSSVGDGAAFAAFARGWQFQEYRFTGSQAGGSIEVELVAERYNVWDSHAVALDYDGNRIGYLAATTAAEWHDIILAANRAGHAVVLPGDLVADRFSEPEDDSPLIPRVWLPSWQRRYQLATDCGLVDVMDKLLARVGESNPPVLETLLDDPWARDHPPRIVRAVSAYATDFPELTWPTHPLAGSRRSELPGCLATHLRSIVLLEREERRARRERAAAEGRREREAADARKKAERAAAERTRAERDDKVVELTKAGMSAPAIAEKLSIRTSHVHQIRSKRGVAADTVNDRAEQLAAERLTRVFEALELSDAGLNRTQISAKLGLNSDSVKDLLRDARFYNDPASDPARVLLANRARAAQRAGSAKSGYAASTGLSTNKVNQSWRDASTLTSLDRWPS